MGNLLMNGMPENVKKELEAIEERVRPIAKKTSRYLFFSLPLIAIALLNIPFVLLFEERNSETFISLFIYALLGAFGFALLKETRMQKKEIQNIGLGYMIERIKKSRILSEDRKRIYVRLVMERPLYAVEHFIRFLEEESRQKDASSDKSCQD